MPDLGAIAVVVPVGRGEQAWRELLPHLNPFGARVLSHTTGEDLGELEHCLTVATPAGRARQLNAGADATSLPWLLFLHADSRPDARLTAALVSAPERDYIGYCTLRYYDGPAWMRLNELGAWIRSRLFGLPFGDQGMFMSRTVFERLGGFDEQVAVGEDHALVWKARHAGIPVLPLGASLATSARRYRDKGWWNTTYAHLALTWSQASAWKRHR